MSRFKVKSLKFKSAALALLLVTSNVFGMSLPFLATQTASAAPICTVDVQGANDESGQKDLTQMCVDAQANPVISWQWDDTAWSGSNTGDGCALFDNDINGLVDSAICVTVGGDPATQQANSPRIYSCGDEKPQTCTNPVLVTGPYVTTCSVTTNGDDPFNNSVDTKASCIVKPSEIGSGSLLDVCSYPSQQPNSDFSDCMVFKANTAKLEVRKVLSPVGSGLFDIKINGTTYANDIGDGGTTGEKVVAKGSVTVLEAENSPTDLALYTTTVVCRDLNGTGSIVAQDTPTGDNTRQLTFTLAVESDVVCIFTNTKINGTLTVVKNLIKDNGATQSVTDFGFKVNGGATIPFESDGSNVLTYPAGTVITSVTEPTANGYTTSYTNCTNITIVADQNKTCTIKNDDIAPTLKLVKTVTNNNGSNKTASNFQAKIDGSNVAWSTAITKSAGAHTASEETSSTHAASVWGGDCAADGSITLTPGQNAICTITNDDIAPSLTLNKVVSNLHGGTAAPSAWTLTATGPSTLTGTGAAGDADVVSTGTFKSGTYTLSESAGPAGYNPSAWTCTNSVVVDKDSKITLANGQTTVCSITNSDVAPLLTIIKEVLNPYGTKAPVSTFPLFVDNTSVTSGVQTAQFDAGTHTVTETNNPATTGYNFTSFTGTNCSINKDGVMSVVLSLSKATTCTITNTAIQPKLTVVKHVVDNYNSGKKAKDFKLWVDGKAAEDTDDFKGSEDGTVVKLNEGYYSVKEKEDEGFTQSFSEDCEGTIAIGQEKVCTVTNTAKPAKLTVKKVVINDNSGDSEASDFSFTIDESDSYWFSNDKYSEGLKGTKVVELEKGKYTVTEDEAEGYTTTYSKGCENVEISNGEEATCTITNNDIPHPEITVEKFGPDTAHEGDEVTYMFVVTNTGDVALDGVTVNDDIAGKGIYAYGDDGNGMLDEQESWVYFSETYTIPSEQTEDVINTVTACSSQHKDNENEDEEENDEDDDEDFVSRIMWKEDNDHEELPVGKICDTDTHTLDVLHPSLNVVKSGPASAQAGSTVTYTFTVTNTGDVSLHTLTVEDSITGDGTYVSGDENENEMLDLDETWIYTAQYKIPANQTANVVNTVTVCALDTQIEFDDRQVRLLDSNDEEEAINLPDPVCATDTHTLAIPQVLGASTSTPAVLGALVNTGSSLLNVYSAIALANLAAVLTLLGYNKRQQAKTTK